MEESTKQHDEFPADPTPMPPPPTRTTSRRPLTPTRPLPMPPTPPRPRPTPTPAPADPRPSELPGDSCSCLLKLREFCPEARKLAGRKGITPSLLFARTRAEAERGVTADSRGWSIRKTWRVREGPLSKVRAVNNQSVMASGGIASGCQPSNASGYQVVQVD